MAQLIFNPDADPESTSVDGQAIRDTSGTWISVRDGGGTDASDTTAQNQTCSIRDNGSVWTLFSRGFFLFDTSALPDDCTIDSATFEVYVVTSGTSNAHTAGVALVETNPSVNTAIGMADYESTDPDNLVRQATDVAIADMNLDAYNTWTLNATGRGNINKTGVTKFGLVIDFDMDDSEQTKVNGESQINVDYSEGTNAPKLTVNYTEAAATRTPSLTLTGVGT